MNGDIIARGQRWGTHDATLLQAQGVPIRMARQQEGVSQPFRFSSALSTKDNAIVRCWQAERRNDRLGS